MEWMEKPAADVVSRLSAGVPRASVNPRACHQAS
jgi:hypothetical protein